MSSSFELKCKLMIDSISECNVKQNVWIVNQGYRRIVCILLVKLGCISVGIRIVHIYASVVIFNLFHISLNDYK